MSRVPQLLRAEMLKIRTARVTWVLLGVMALVTFVVVALAATNLSGDELAGTRGTRKVLTLGASVAYLFTLALGVVGMATEYRHDTLGQALLAAPARWPVFVAKLLAYAVTGLGFGLVALTISFAVGVPALAAEDAAVSLSSPLVRYIVIGSLLAPALFGVIGVGLAALLRDQALALGVGLGWALLIDSLVISLAPEVGKFLPGGAVISLLRTETQDVLPAGIAALALLAYALILAISGTLVARRRDVM